MMLAASDDHIHGAGVGVGEEKRRAVEEMKRKKNTEHRAHHMEDKEKQGDVPSGANWSFPFSFLSSPSPLSAANPCSSNRSKVNTIRCEKWLSRF